MPLKVKTHINTNSIQTSLCKIQKQYAIEKVYKFAVVYMILNLGFIEIITKLTQTPIHFLRLCNRESKRKHGSLRYPETKTRQKCSDLEFDKSYISWKLIQ
ncbi:hypothetical protein CARUB_v10019614mg [Capsella rubella]|uniref:Uncharacterized protein n=1 Tax=Capsella rubella TaxID=81985 RepID=R0FUF1_9BRAS|nr:hypothetical protein CARUB_v10019614mg [Capsella rubella]